MSFRQAGGIHFSDPREFFRALSVTGGVLSVMDASGTTTGDQAAGFFTEMGRRGVADNTNWTADTYKTLLSISSGMGYVSHLIGPIGLAGTPTTTFEITVDGTLYTVAVTATGITQRAVLGPIPQSSAGVFFTTAKSSAYGANAIDAGKTTQTFAGTVLNPEILPWSTLRMLGTPCLVFRNSLLIRAKSSESNSTTTNNERQSAIQYMVMA